VIQPPGIKAGDRVRVTTGTGVRDGYVRSSTPETLVLWGLEPSFDWSQVRRLERRVLNPAGPVVGAFIGAIVLAVFGWYAAFLMTWGDTAQYPGWTFLLVAGGAALGAAIGGVCGMVVRRWEVAYDREEPPSDIAANV
jgi:hypothetical protein